MRTERPCSTRIKGWMPYVTFLSFVLSSLALFVASTPKEVQKPSTSDQLLFIRHPIFENEWAREAVHKLDAWRNGLFERVALLYRTVEFEKYGTLSDQNAATPRIEPDSNRIFDLYAAADYLVDCPTGNLSRVGSTGDGGKFICVNFLASQMSDCVVYSLGSNNQFDFEQDILTRTNCTVHTFDCTSPPRVLDPGRHFYHNICFGKKSGERDGRTIKTYNEVVASLGHSRVHLLKMDIEGWEYEVFSGFDWKSCDLPLHISVEVHRKQLYSMTNLHNRVDYWGELFWARHQLSAAEMGLFFVHLGNLGYAPLSQEYNSGTYHDQCCDELTLFRVEQPARCLASHAHV